MNAAAPVVVSASALHKSYDDNYVLDGVDLDVRQGETVVILGASGSGKSTLLRCLIGLERPDSGTVRIHGTDIFAASRRELTELRKHIGVAFQAGALFGSMTVAENVELPLAEFTDMPPTTRRIVARIKLGMVGLEDAMDRLPSELSGGMIKRAALARALALDPDVLFFDEPSAGLDPITAAGLDQLVLQLKQYFDVTLVVVTHELESAFAISDRVALMHQGRFLVVDAPETVRSCENPVVRAFLERRAPEHAEDAAKFRRFLEEL